MDTVSFTKMADGTREDYELVASFEAQEQARFPDRVKEWLRSMDGPSPYKISRLEHSLQVATRAERAGEDEELVVCALLHDIGDVLAPHNHSEVAAAVLRPFVSEKNYWIVKHHGVFQGYYYFHHYGEDRNARDQYRDHPYYTATVAFCENYDQSSFEPDYAWEPLEHFEPLMRRLFATG